MHWCMVKMKQGTLKNGINGLVRNKNPSYSTPRSIRNKEEKEEVTYLFKIALNSRLTHTGFLKLNAP